MAVFAAILLQAACTQVAVLEEFRPHEGSGVLQLDISNPAAWSSTRSSLAVDDALIRHLDLWFYENGSLCESLTESIDLSDCTSYSTRKQLEIGHSYEIFAYANAVEHTAPSTVAEAEALVYVFPGLTRMNELGIPMSVKKSITMQQEMGTVEMELRRLVAKFNLELVTSALQHGSLEIQSVRVCQMNSRVSAFGSRSAASASSEVCDGDYSSNESSSTFYILENCQGNLLPHNTNPDNKVHDSLLAEGENPSLCTYLEIKGNYSDKSGQMTGEPLVAHLFLGTDSCSNFDVHRNSTYSVTVNFTDQGCLRADWKIDGHLDDRRILEFSPSSQSIYAGQSGSVNLLTNLSCAEGDYSWSVSGDTDCFSVTANDAGQSFAIGAQASCPKGKQLVLEARTWDGGLQSTAVVSCEGLPSENPDPSPITVVWTKIGNKVYIAQQAEFTLIDGGTGSYPSGAIGIVPDSDRVRIESEGSTWKVRAIRYGDVTLDVTVDGIHRAYAELTVIPPELHFQGNGDIYLPIDGRQALAGPYYYTHEGARMHYDDFEPDLYEELLKVHLQRDISTESDSQWWEGLSDGSHPLVSVEDLGEEEPEYAFCLYRLSYDGHSIMENYDFNNDEIYLEDIAAFPARADIGVQPVGGRLYTEDPFHGSVDFGEMESWKLARWYNESIHDEQFTFSIQNLLKEGNNIDLASCIYPFSSEGKYSFSFDDRNTLRMTILYDSFKDNAMPEYYFSFYPVMQNANSGELYRSVSSYSVNFTVNLSVGGYLTQNGAGGYDVEVRWGHPLLNPGNFASVQDYVAASDHDSMYYTVGMYRRYYSIYGSSIYDIRDQNEPDFVFCDISSYPTSGASSVNIQACPYVPPLSYTEGRKLKIWKYQILYPYSNGWLP